ncbi:obscurin [Apis cerana cerana]|uniref:Obscurin n=1 Tax=Apis cerana cerana TaxID=94128 RepID=A0A2A3EEW2_APICC|nr:obscurin [Apis cerana cerana]
MEKWQNFAPTHNSELRSRTNALSLVKTDMGASGAISRLYIANANKKDSGNYSCALADVAAATTVSVHVLNELCRTDLFYLFVLQTKSRMLKQSTW